MSQLRLQFEPKVHTQEVREARVDVPKEVSECKPEISCADLYSS